MDLMTIAIVYLGFAVVSIALLLFGQSPMFTDTPVAWAHWLMTEGIWLGLERAMVCVCGQGVQRHIENVMEICCDRPNRVLQISYVCLLVVGYWMYWANLFALLPNKWVGDIHVVTGSASLFVCVVTFVMASWSDPGIITEETVEAHAAMYPLDVAIWHEKTCVTCKWARPARSKHCRVCGHCVARHDHHCGWINNCVGLGNHRLFLLFLVSNLIMTVYGAVLAVMILLGLADQSGVLRHQFLDTRTGQVTIIHLPAARVFEWLVVWAPGAVALSIFMVAVVLLVVLFLGNQLWMIAQGKTQYEVYRWKDLHRAMTFETEARQQETLSSSHDANTQGDASYSGSDGGAPGEGDARGAKRKGGKKGQGKGMSGAGGSVGSDGAGTQGRREGQAGAQGRREGKAKRGLAGRCLLWFGRRVGWLPPGPKAVVVKVVKVPDNVYDKGVWQNFSEVLFPYHHLRKHSKRR